MKRTKAPFLFTLSILIVCAVFFGAKTNAAASALYTVKDITLQPGSDESIMNFCWYSSTGNSYCYVQVEKASEMMGSAFSKSSTSFSGTVSSSSSGYLSNKVTVTGLVPQTEYFYIVGNGSSFSSAYSFNTRNSSSYNAIFISDAQIGASGNISNDTAAWKSTLSTALGNFDNTSFILSAGDQVDYYSESEYDGFLASPLLRNIPVVPTVGNHENISSSPLNSYHYYEPNESSEYGLTPAGGDYWFRYGYTLYMVLNTNNTDVSEHDAFMGQALTTNSDVGFTVLMFHQSIYSAAEHSTDSSIVSLRNSLYPVIDKYHIDLVLSGHDHCYTRTYPMCEGTARKSQTNDSQGRIANPTGTIYITAGSASGSKYYDMKTTTETYAAVRMQLYTPTFSNITVSGNILTVSTFRVDTMKEIDTVSIVKNTSSGFVDVPSNAWYTPAVEFIAGKSITTGTGNATFGPNAALTRGQFMVLLMRAYGITPNSNSTDNFADAGNTYYTSYLATAKRLGIAQGSGSNKFQPESNISRQDMFVLLYNALKTMNKLPSTNSSSIKSYSDEDQIASYAKTAINVLTVDGTVSGSSGKINPTVSSNRAQMAQLLYNLLSK